MIVQYGHDTLTSMHNSHSAVVDAYDSVDLLGNIILTGAHSTGKTTLMNILKKNNVLPLFTYLPSLTRELIKYGYDNSGDDISQAIVTTNQLRRHDDIYDKGYLYDRCCIDGYAYARALHKQGKISDKALEHSRLALDDVVDKIKLVFYLAPEFEVVADGVRPDAEFQKAVDAEYRYILEDLYKDQVVAYKLSGSVEERVQQLVFILNNEIRSNR